MRGGFLDQGRLFSYISPEARVPANHPSFEQFQEDKADRVSLRK